MSHYDRPILLIEDNPMDVDLTLRAFAKRKLANPIEVARDGEEALAYLLRWEAGEGLPVVILLDINLPKVNGLEVLHQIKSHPVSQKVPVIILTTSAEDRDIQIAYEKGANSYIVKPVDFAKFVEVASQIDLYWNVINIPPT
ncbi:MAG: response regulator [Anaerolineales bacterium]|nr:response regulator [Anaerolineales bacterium]